MKINDVEKYLKEGDVVPFVKPTKGYFFKLFGYLEDNAGNLGWIFLGQYQTFDEVKDRAEKLIKGFGVPSSAILPKNLAIFRYEKGLGDRGEPIDVRELGIPKHAVEVEEAKGDIRKALGGVALAGLLGYGAMKANNDMDQQAYSKSVQLPQLELYLDYAEQQGDARMIKQLKQRIGDHKMRLSLGKGDVRDGNSKPIEVVYDKEGKAQGPDINEAVSADMQNMFDELRVSDNTYISDGNKELALDEVGPGFYSLGYDRDGTCFEMTKIDKQRAKDNITGYGEYKVADAEITDFNGARYYWNENMADSGVLHIKKGVNEAEEPKADKSARHKLDHSLRAQGHKVEKDRKKELKKGAIKHKGKLYDHLIALEGNTDIPFHKCPKCQGPIFHEAKGKKDACYHKVKSRYKVWPSAYASGALVKCRKVGAKNWGNKSKKK